MARHRRSPKKSAFGWDSYGSRQSNVHQLRRQSLQCSWALKSELPADRPQTAGLVIQTFQGVATPPRTSVCEYRTFPDLRLIYGWHVTTLWLRCPAVRYVSTNQANSAFHPFGVFNWVLIHVITWIAGVQIIKRQTRAACVVVSLQPIGCTSALSVTYSAAAFAFALWRYINVIPFIWSLAPKRS